MSYLNDIYDYIKNGETENENLGLEIEHFVINKKGEQITFDEISPLIKSVGKEIGAEILYVDEFPAGYSNDRYTITLEPSCQFEISINPYSELSRIEKVYMEFLSLWEPLFKERGYRLVTKGNLPLVECGDITPDEIPLTPKKRYQYMDAYFQKSGQYGKYMMRTSGGQRSEKSMFIIHTLLADAMTPAEPGYWHIMGRFLILKSFRHISIRRKERPTAKEYCSTLLTG